MIEDTQKIRDIVNADRVRLSNSASHSVMHLIDDNGKSVCNFERKSHCRGGTNKKMSVFPLGYHGWCSDCFKRTFSEFEMQQYGIK